MEPEMTTDEKAQSHNRLVDYRLDELQRTLNTLNTTINSMNSQLITIQLSLPDRFLSRVDFNERQQETERRFEEIGKKETAQDKALQDLQTRWDNRMWGFLGTAVLAMISLAVGVGNILASVLQVHLGAK